MPPHTREMACTVLRLVAAATFGRANATAKHTMEYTAKQMPPPSPPSANRRELGSFAPNTWRAVIKPKNIHMQNRPSQVNIWTTARRFIVSGISAIADPISLNALPIPVVWLFFFRNSSRFSGGYSFDVRTVHNTHNKKAAAPILNE